MKILIDIPDVGPKHLHWTLEEYCEIGNAKRVLATMQQTAETLTGCANSAVPSGNKHNGSAKSLAATRSSTEQPPASSTKNFIPASDEGMRALYAAAKSNGTDIPSVCKEHDVDPNHISKEECREMTRDLNDRSGYSKIQQAQHQSKNPRYPPSSQ
jgi:hypothetical protein